MSRIEAKLVSLKAQKKAGLVSFVMAGDPDLKTSYEIIKSLINSGSSVIEIGMPFSDPVADGPAIQRSGIRALANKTNLKSCFELVANLRKEFKDIPFVLMGYSNPIFKYGFEKFLLDAEKASVDGLILVDLPFEENKDYVALCKKHNISLIQLLSPNTDKQRVSIITKAASGFCYYVSSNATTGTKEPELLQIEKKVAEIRSVTDINLAVGFGITKKDQAAEIAKYADLIVIGSKYVRLVEEELSSGRDPLVAIESFNQEIVSVL